MAKALIENGVDVQETDRYGRRALSWATERGYHEVIQLLLNNGDNLTASGIPDESPNIQAENTVGRTPLCWAAEYGSNTMVKFLLDRGIDCEFPIYDGQAGGHYRGPLVTEEIPQ